MVPIAIRPKLDDLPHYDSHLPEMRDYIARLLETPDPQETAHNAAMAYLTLITAFVDKGLLECMWAPRIVIDVGLQEYEGSIVG